MLIGRPSRNVVAVVSNPPKMHRFWRIRHIPNDTFEESEQHIRTSVASKFFRTHQLCLVVANGTTSAKGVGKGDGKGELLQFGQVG